MLDVLFVWSQSRVDKNTYRVKRIHQMHDDRNLLVLMLMVMIEEIGFVYCILPVHTITTQNSVASDVNACVSSLLQPFLPEIDSNL